MVWSKALKLAVPVWLLVGAMILAIDHVADAKATVVNLVIGLAAAYPVIAFIIKETAEDIAKWRAAFSSKSEK